MSLDRTRKNPIGLPVWYYFPTTKLERMKRDDGGGSTDGRCAAGRTVARELTAVSWEGAAAGRRQQPLLLSRVAGDKKKNRLSTGQCERAR